MWFLRVLRSWVLFTCQQENYVESYSEVAELNYKLMITAMEDERTNLSDAWKKELGANVIIYFLYYTRLKSKPKRCLQYFGTLQIHMDLFLMLRAQDLNRINDAREKKEMEARPRM